ncbi:MAG: acyl-CoA dehydrogenase FadE [Oceanicaulis sp. HLUCCA04]|nr:MAG: acyl-CoA dehydrogenase FadE [Oceanicaulis sp. HLUCCA04]
MLSSLRRTLITRPLMRWYAGVLPDMSDTETQAIEAGTVWWDQDIMSGKPDWEAFAAIETGKLTAAEQAFIDGPVEQLCAMLDDWQIEHTLFDLPENVWAFMVAEGFFAMIIPEEYGGKGFSAFAHSQIVRRIGTRSITAAITVMVPNSLGPGELLMLYGTDAQKDHYLPRLASGKDIPCFALTGVEAGSDASGMSDYGVVTERKVDGKTVLGIAFTCNKRYITLAPVATLIGLAIRLYDPDGLLGGEEDLGITVLLVPADTPGVKTGHRHLPAGLAFQNGPVEAEGAFVPLDHVLGGREQIGKGWKMLMGALAAGRGISLPSMSCAGASVAAYTSASYARVREQFGLPIGQFEGIREPLARLAGCAYQLDAARRLTAAGIDSGEKPAVVSAIMKYHATERLRQSINDAMDIHAGKAIIEGPRNYLATAYKSLPVAITVEGANILTRSLIIFGQGAIRCHPYLLKEMEAVRNPDAESGLTAFDRLLFAHVGHDIANFARTLWHGLTFGRFASAPAGAGDLAPHYRALSHASARLAVVSEMALGILGGALKRKESLSARLGDILSEIYLLCAAVKRFETEGQLASDRPTLDWCMADGLHRIEERLRAVIDHFPGLYWRVILRLVICPLGLHRKPPSDALMNTVAEGLMEPGDVRDRLAASLYRGAGDDPLTVLDRGYEAIVRRDALLAKVKKAGVTLDDAVGQGVLTRDEYHEIIQAKDLIREVLVTDAFEPADIAPARQAAQ